MRFAPGPAVPRSLLWSIYVVAVLYSVATASPLVMDWMSKCCSSWPASSRRATRSPPRAARETPHQSVRQKWVS